MSNRITASDEKLGRFDHHPDPAIDLEIEVEIIQGLTEEALCGMTRDNNHLMERIARVASLNVISERAVTAKLTAWVCGQQLTAAWAS